jgi:cysteine desulfurase
MNSRDALIVIVVCTLVMIAVIMHTNRGHCDRHRQHEVYLDCNATTHMLDEAVAEYVRLSRSSNPASSYRSGVHAKIELENSRRKIADSIGANDGTLIFTSGGSESNNAVIRAFAKKGRILVTMGEHASVSEVEKSMTDFVPITHDGSVNEDALHRILRGGQNHVLLCIILANNEIGTLNPIGNIVTMCRELAPNIHVHVDAVQAIGKIPGLDLDEIGADSYSFSAHKFGGPRGFGGLYIRRNKSEIEPLIRGGKQEDLMRAGTSNTPSAVAATAALRIYSSASAEHWDTMIAQRTFVRRELLRLGAKMLGHPTACLPQTVSACLPGTDSRSLLKVLDKRGVTINVGSACSMGGRSRVLDAMGIPFELERGAIRISWSPFTSWNDIRYGMSVISDVVTGSAT